MITGMAHAFYTRTEEVSGGACKFAVDTLKASPLDLIKVFEVYAFWTAVSLKLRGHGSFVGWGELRLADHLRLDQWILRGAQALAER